MGSKAQTVVTNTLPIRRLGLTPGESAEINVVYFAIPELSFRPVRQRYTCLEAWPVGWSSPIQSYGTASGRASQPDRVPHH